MATEPNAREAARILGKTGASKGGKARAAKLTAEQRKDIARNAVQARWAKAKRIAIKLPLTQAEKDVMENAAERSGEDLGAWALRVLLAASGH